MSDTDEISFQRKCAEFIDRNVLCCVSGLVHTLTKEYHDNECRLTHAKDLCEQAAELCYPVEDYEEAARQDADSGAQIRHDHTGYYICTDEEAEHEDAGNPSVGFDGREHYATTEDAARAYCDEYRIDPHEWEVYEHWAVTDYFAEKLRQHGERVGELDNLTVWGRTTTGQAISMDSVVRSIVKGL